VFPDEVPMKETNPSALEPLRRQQGRPDLLGYQYFQSYGLPIVRPAASTTPTAAGEVFVTSTLASRLAEIEKGVKEPVIQVGTSMPSATSTTSATSSRLLAEPEKG